MENYLFCSGKFIMIILFFYLIFNFLLSYFNFLFQCYLFCYLYCIFNHYQFFVLNFLNFYHRLISLIKHFEFLNFGFCFQIYFSNPKCLLSCYHCFDILWQYYYFWYHFNLYQFMMLTQSVMFIFSNLFHTWNYQFIF